jgi:hypothetical protein
MTDEDKKTIVSEPPPPTDEIDNEWGDDDETLVRDAPSLSDPPRVSVKSSPAPAGSPSVKPQAAEPAETAAAPVSDPPVAAAASPSEEDEEEDEDEDEDEQDEEDEDEDEDEDEQDEEDAEASAQPLHRVSAPGQDWIPEWAPFAVLGALVCGSIVIGLGLIGGSDAKAGEEEGKAEKAPAASSAAKPLKPVKPSGHP